MNSRHHRRTSVAGTRSAADTVRQARQGGQIGPVGAAVAPRPGSPASWSFLVSFLGVRSVWRRPDRELGLSDRSLAELSVF